MLLRRLLRELEGEFQHAVDADAGENRFLHDDLALGAGKRPPADRRILAFGVLAHDPEVDVAGLAVRQRRRHARHQPDRAQVDVLVELATEQDQRAPQRDVIRDLRRPADRAEEDRVVLADLLLPVLRHHALVLGVVVVGGEVEPVLPHLEAELLRDRLERAHAFRHDLLADAVARNDGDTIDAIGRHGTFPWTLPGWGPRPGTAARDAPTLTRMARGRKSGPQARSGIWRRTAPAWPFACSQPQPGRCGG